MKGFKYLLATLTLLLSLFSCQKEPIVESLEHGNGPLEDNCVYFSLQSDLRAVANAPDTKMVAEFNEMEIENITIVAFQNRKVSQVIDDSNINYNEPNDKGKGGFVRFEQGSQQSLQFIANASPEFIKKIKPGMTLENFKLLQVDKTLPQHKERGFVMLSPKAYLVDLSANKYVSLGVIPMRRLAARIDVYNIVKGFNMDKITVKNRQIKSFLTAQPDNSAPESSTEEKVFEQHPNWHWFSPSEAVAGIYTYERKGSGEFTIIVEGTYNMNRVKLEIPLQEKSGNYVNIKRNYLYRIIIDTKSITNPQTPEDFFFDIQILDWEKAEKFEYEDHELSKMEHVSYSTPLDYFSDWNVKDLNGNWDKENDITGKSLFNWQESMNAFAGGKEIGGRTFYLPTQEEWLAIIPVLKQNILEGGGAEINVSDISVKSGGKDYTVNGKILKKSENLAYGSYTYTAKPGSGASNFHSIVSYEYKPNLFGVTKAGLTIKMATVPVLIPVNQVETSEALNKGTLRIFPAAGHRLENNQVSAPGVTAFYWSATAESGESAICANFNDRNLNISDYQRVLGFSVRLVTRGEEKGTTIKKTPLDYVAEKNMKDLKGTWDDTDDTTGKFLFLWQESLNAYACGKKIDNKIYYLPTKEEWLSIIPYEKTILSPNSELLNISNTPVRVAGKNYFVRGQIQQKTPKLSYASYTYTPYFGTEGSTLHIIASYEFKDNYFASGGDALVIKMTAVKKDVSQISSADFNSCTSRVLPAAGRLEKGALKYPNKRGHYWTATEYSDKRYAWRVFFRGENPDAYVNVNWEDITRYSFSIRLFTRD